MITGQLNKILTFYPETQAQGSDGYFTNTEGTGVVIRASVKQLSGYRKMQYTELINQEVYEVVCFDHAVISKNSRVTYGSKTLFIHSIIDDDDSSFMEKRKLILHTKI